MTLSPRPEAPAGSEDPWRDRLLAPDSLLEGPPAGRGPALPRLLRAFLAAQEAAWPRLAEASRQLAGIASRAIPVGDRRVLLQCNPGRTTSTTARVDPRSVSERPCFLCPGNLPAEERGLPFGPSLVVLPNPAPILPLHLSVAHREHRPQRLLDVLDDALELALAGAGGLSVLYNGPRCGASAPDHLHLQAVAARRLPEERALRARLGPRATAPPGLPIHHSGSLDVWSTRDSGRATLVFAGETPRVGAALRLAHDALGAVTGAPGEPLLNLLVTSLGARAAPGGPRLLALLFPRGAHRPACYHAQGEASCLVSPGAVDMAGLVVAVREVDYRRLDSALLTGIYRETTLARAARERLEQDLGSRLAAHA